jgi:hypothetical protein
MKTQTSSSRSRSRAKQNGGCGCGMPQFGGGCGVPQYGGGLEWKDAVRQTFEQHRGEILPNGHKYSYADAMKETSLTRNRK